MLELGADFNWQHDRVVRLRDERCRHINPIRGTRRLGRISRISCLVPIAAGCGGNHLVDRWRIPSVEAKTDRGVVN